MKMRRLLARLSGLLALVLLVAVLAACSSAAKSSEEPEVAKPSNPGGTGEAVNLTGDKVKGAEIFSANCVSCHGEEGKGGVENPGAAETVPALNPIDETMVSSDYKTFASNLDLFIEHGSAPEGKDVTLSMLPFGDNKTLQPQDIADVIAYVISLNTK
jgi:mono/diheme cytochrome c family protein